MWLRFLIGLAFDGRLQPGGTGYLGDSLTEQLSHLGRSAVAVDDDVDGSTGVVRQGRRIQWLMSHERVAAGAKRRRFWTAQPDRLRVMGDRWSPHAERLDGEYDGEGVR